MLGDDLQRAYRIDIETNSTVDAEATEDKADMGELMNAIAQFLNGVAPAVEQGILPFDAAKAILLGVVRRYRFGSEVEDMLLTMQAPKSAGGGEEAKAQQAELQKQSQELQKQAQELEKAKQELKLEEQRLAMKASQDQLELNLRQQYAEMELKLRLQLENEKQKLHADVLQEKLNMREQEVQEKEAEFERKIMGVMQE